MNRISRSFLVIKKQNFVRYNSEVASIPSEKPAELNWSTSFHGVAREKFPERVVKILMSPINILDVEIKPDGLIYLPEIKYRRILNLAFGPGGWGLAPRSDHSLTTRTLSREYALICQGRFVSQARGEQEALTHLSFATSAEACKSNALMRCCKDLGVASELWDPNFIRKFKQEFAVMTVAEHVLNKRRTKLWRRKDRDLPAIYKEIEIINAFSK